MPSNIGRLPKLIFALLVIVALEGWFFRGILRDSDRLIGDATDSRFINLVLEHWFSVFSGREAPADLPIFYPERGTLGYSDALFGFALPYVLLRALNIDPFTANKLVLLGLHALGSVAFFLLLSRKFRFRTLIALVGCVLFSYSSAYAVRAVHSQFFFMSFLPVFLFFVVSFVSNLSTSTTRRMPYGIAALLSLGLILFTTFYIGFFMFLFSLSLLAGFLLLKRRNLKDVAGRVLSFIRRNYVEVFVYLLVFCASILPSALIYFPTHRLVGSAPWDEVASLLPQWFDFFNTSSRSILWGHMLTSMIPDLLTKRYAHELQVGFPLITLGFLAWSIAYVIRRVPSGQDGGSGTYFRTFALSILALLVLLLKVNGLSLWWFVYSYLPAGGNIRAPARLLLFLTLPGSILICWCLNRYVLGLQRPAQRVLFGCVILAVLLADQGQYGGVSSSWDRRSMEAFLTSVPVPPTEVKVFYLVDNRKDRPWYLGQLDAWTLAAKYHLKTINGYSGYFPRRFWPLIDLYSPEYGDRVSQYVGAYDIQDVWQYDISEGTWAPFQKLSALVSFGERYTFASPAKGSAAVPFRVGEGWSSSEEEGCWTDGHEARLRFLLPKAKTDLVLNFAARAFAPNGPLEVEVLANGVAVTNLSMPGEQREYSIRIPGAIVPRETLEIAFDIKNPLTPISVGIGKDMRVLGMYFQWLALNDE